MGLKVFAYGFIMGPKAYIRDTWNILDFIIVVGSIFDVAMILVIF